LNRVRWDLRSKGATTFSGLILRSANPARGPLVPPGTYRVRLTADGQSQEQALAVLKDPRLRDVTDADLQAQYELARQVSDRTGDAHQAVIRIRDLKAQIADRLAATPPAALKTTADTLLRKLSDIEEAIYQVKNRSPKDPLNFPIRLNNRIAALQDVIEAADARPTQQAYDVFKELSTELQGHLSRLEQVLTTDVAEFNRSLAQMGREPVVVLPVQSMALVLLDGVALDSHPFARVTRRDDGRPVFSLPSGRYEFVMPAEAGLIASGHGWETGRGSQQR
jgi:hypothetical protein